LRVRRTLPVEEIRTLPLDSSDMFILSRLEHPMSLIELAEVAPCDIGETMSRVRALVELGAVQLFVDEAAEQQDAQREQRSSAGPRERRESSYDRDDPPTGVRLKLDVNVESRKRVLIGAVVLGRMKRS
jgi:hypothetical protein